MSLISFLPMSGIVELTAEIIQQNKSEREEARAEKKIYLEKLENASGEEIFKLMNLISFANMDEFNAEANPVPIVRMLRTRRCTTTCAMHPTDRPAAHHWIFA